MDGTDTLVADIGRERNLRRLHYRLCRTNELECEALATGNKELLVAVRAERSALEIQQGEL
jgi:hypothetical protein